MKRFDSPHPGWSTPDRPRLERVRRVLASPWFLFGALVLAAVLRVWHVFSLRHQIFFHDLILDSEFYDAWARRLASGDWLDGHQPFFFDPLYPYFLAALYRIIGRDVLLVRLVNVFLGVLTVGVVAIIGRKAADSAVGNVAALLYAVYRPAIFEEAEIEKTALGVFLMACAMALALCRPRWTKFLAGIAIGLAALARGNAVLLIPLGCAYFLLSSGGMREGFRCSVAFVAGALIALTPAAWRNHRVSGEWILTTAGAGPNLYLGNNPWNPTGAYQYLPWMRPQSAHEQEDWHAETERRVGHPVSASDVSNYWLRETFRYAVAQPGRVAVVLLRKVALLIANSELPDGWGVNFVSRFSPALRLPLLSMATLLPLAVVGAIVEFRNRKLRLVAGTCAYYVATLVAFFVFARFRVYYVTALAVLAAAALCWMLTARTSRIVVALVAAGVLGLVSVGAGPWAGVTNDRVHSYQFTNLAMLYVNRGDLLSARRVLLTALAEHRGAAPLCGLGEVLRRSGDLGESLRYFDECVQTNPVYPDAWYQLGLAHESVGDRASALRAYSQQLELVPGHREASLRLRMLMQY